jgi:hypothetical protein
MAALTFQNKDAATTMKNDLLLLIWELDRLLHLK